MFIIRMKLNPPNISPPVSLDLRNIRQPTHRKPEKSPPKRTCDGLAYACLSHTWRAYKADDFALNRTAQLANSKELKDACLDIGETIVVCVENALCIWEGEVFRRVGTPGDLFGM